MTMTMIETPKQRYERISALIDSVLSSKATPDEWKEEYVKLATDFLQRNAEFEGGQICGYCRLKGLPDPHHHNVWGAMLRTLVALGLIEKIGTVTPTTRHTHIDRVALWKSLVFKGLE